MRIRKMLAGLLAGAMALSLTGCRDISPEQMEQYVQGELDACYLGQYDPAYLELLGITEEEAAESYERNIEEKTKVFLNFIRFDLTYLDDAVETAAQDCIRQVYTHSSYTVKDAEKLESGDYGVTVQVAPIDLMQQLSARLFDAEGFHVVRTQLMVEHGYYDESEIPDAAAFEREYAMQVIDMALALLPQVGYLAEETVELQLELEENAYTMDEDDWATLDEKIIDYEDAAA